MSFNKRGLVISLLVVMFSVSTMVARAQNINASIDGQITDQGGAIVAGAAVTLVSQDTGRITAKFISASDGLYSFRNVVPGNYELRVRAAGFKEYVRTGIFVRVGYPIRLNVQLAVGAVTQQVEVRANASALNFDNATLRKGIDPQVIKQVPLLVAGSIRSAANFAAILPGIVRGTGDVTGAHIDGSQSSTGTVILDGVPLFNPSGVQGLTGAVLDFPQSPDVISEFQVLTSSYGPQYPGSGGVTIEHVRSGTDKYHGTVYEYNRNTAFNAIQWGGSSKPQDVENDFGGNLGGPFSIPFVNKKHVRTYFFGNFEGFTIAGGTFRQTLSLPSAQERTGDFSDWVDSSGQIIPIYDPATTRPNPAYNPSQPTGPQNLPYLRDQFMGCNGTTPNVICPSDPRMQNSLAPKWFNYLPGNTSSGPLNNYLAPATPNFLGTNAYTYLEKIDAYIGSKDHISELFSYKYLPETTATQLPVPISNTGTSFKRTPVIRVNYDHIFNERIVNHLGFGWQDDKYYGGGIDGKSAADVPQINGVASHDYPPAIQFGDGFTGYGTAAGDPFIQPWLSATYLVNDVIYLTKGKHNLTFGGDFRAAKNSPTFLGNESGTFRFAATETGLLGMESGNSMASFLLGQVDSAAANFYTSTTIVARQISYAVFVGDIWRATPKLSISPGVRYEIDPPWYEANNRFAYFDQTASNPGAGNLPGSVAYAGTGVGRSGKRYPEFIWYKAFAPRLGVVYAVGKDTVIRSGYGIFFDNANMPGYDGGITQDGYNTYANFSSSQGGMKEAFNLSDGIPSTYQVPPRLIPTVDNGQNSPIYRPRDANRLPYAQEWNLTVGHEFRPGDHVSISYVGNRGTRLLSQLDPLNALKPSDLALGQSLYDVFQVGQPELDGVPAPFSTFATTMTGCSASVAQALVKYPQYCNAINGRNENKGSSTYHSLQVTAEHRLSGGLWALLTYTKSKLITKANSAEGVYNTGIISPYQPARAKTLAIEDVPQVINLALTYQLPFGTGKRWMNQRGLRGIGNEVFGGWVVSGVFRAQSGMPFSIYSSNCNVPIQFQGECLPGLLPHANPYAQSRSHLDVSRPLLNVASFEPVSSFNFYTGYGRPVQNFRQPGYSDLDIGIQKIFHLTDRTTFQLRGDAFNAANAHHFNLVGVSLQGNGLGGSAFTTDIASPGFGSWNGAVTQPRSIQVSGRISF